MRPLEWLFIVTLLAALLVRFFPSQRWGWLFTLAPLVVIGLHVAREQPRWQMAPLYVLALVLFVASLPLWGGAAQRPLLGWTLLGLLALLLFSLLPVLLPVPDTLTPSGPYLVGTHIFDWVDETRQETLAGAPAGKRRLMVQVWYPAVAAPAARAAPYLDRLNVQAPALARVFNLPGFVLSHVNLAATHAYVDAPVIRGNGPLGTDERLPVLVFSHGWRGFRLQNSYQMEELASQGYVVFAADHTYGAAVTAFSDGSTAYNRRELLPGGGSDAAYQQAAQKLGAVWAADIGFVLDQAAGLDRGEIDSPLKGTLDLGKVGILGHSTGGGAAVQFCDIDARCQAGLAMDAWLVPYSRDIPAKGLRMPFLFMQSEGWPKDANADLLPALYDHMQAPAWRLTIAGTKHFDFTDIALFSPLAASLGIKGPIDGRYNLEMINAYSVAFFDAVLRGQRPSTLLLAPAPNYPEVRYEQR